jgi:hypothetical protein
MLVHMHGLVGSEDFGAQDAGRPPHLRMGCPPVSVGKSLSPVEAFVQPMPPPVTVSKSGQYCYREQVRAVGEESFAS